MGWLSGIGDIFEDVVDIFPGGDIVTDIVGGILDDEGNGDGGVVINVGGGGGGGIVSSTGPVMSGNGGGGGRVGQYVTVGGGGVVSAMSVLPLIPRASAAVGAMGRIARWGKNMGAVLAGKGVQLRARDALEIVKKYGPEVAAGVLGWTVAELMSVLGNLGAFSPKKRRRRGISARDVRTTRRVCNFVQTISRQLAECRPRARGAARGRGSAQFVRQG